MIYSIPEDADYDRIRQLVQLRIDSDRQRGGDLARLSDLHQRFLADHATASRRRGDPCEACGNPWPCGVVRGIVTGLD